MKTALSILLGTVVGGALGGVGGLAWIATERCAGPACAGLVFVALATAVGGAIAGGLLTLGWILFVRPKPLPKAFRAEAERGRAPAADRSPP